MGQAIGCTCGQEIGSIQVPKNDYILESVDMIENSEIKQNNLEGEASNNILEENSDNTKYQLKSQIIKNKIEQNNNLTIEEEFSLNLEKIAKLIPPEENNSELNKYTSKNILQIEKNLSDINNNENYPNTIIKEAYEFKNNIIYKGSWNINNYKKEGFGILIDEEGNKYTGNFIDDKMNGKGRLFNKEGDYFEGEFVNGEIKKGKLILKNGYYLEGEFKNGKLNGKGIEKLNNTYSYEGNFLNGKKNGEGIYKWEDGAIYIGNITNNLIDGNGDFKWNDGRNYKGEFKNNLIEGKGEFYWPDGKKYIGNYKFNKKNGFGKYFWSDNIFYEGDWVNNQQHGNGMFCENNNIIKGIFRFGKLIKIQEGNLNDKKEDDLKNNINEKMQIDEKEIKIFDNHEFEVKKEDTHNKNSNKLNQIKIEKGKSNINNPMNMMIKNKLGNKKKENQKTNGGGIKRNFSIVPEREDVDVDDDSNNND